MQRIWWIAGWTWISSRLSWQWRLTPSQAALARLKAVGWEECLFMLSIYADSSGILSLVFRSLPPPTKKEMPTNWRESRRLPPRQWAGWRIKRNPREAERGRLVSIVEQKATGSWKQHNLIEAFYHQEVKVTDKSLPDFPELQSKKEGGRVDKCHWRKFQLVIKIFQSEDLVSTGTAAEKGDRISTLKNFHNLAGLWATQISFWS